MSLKFKKEIGMDAEADREEFDGKTTETIWPILRMSLDNFTSG